MREVHDSRTIRMAARSTVTTGRRTTLREGYELEYERIHARVPDDLAQALLSAGVVSWHIWRDGRYLFHAIETLFEYATMVQRLAEIGYSDPGWDAMIANLLESDPVSDRFLDLVWSLDTDGQLPAGT